MERAKHFSPIETPLLQEFFKVFMPTTSSTHLGLPKAFTEFFNGITPNKATLVDHGGHSWDIDLEKINDDELVLTNGWEQFVTDKCLEEADFLVFEYDGNCTFYVKIFSKNGIRKLDAANCGNPTFFVNIFSRSGIRKEPANGGKVVPIVMLYENCDNQSCREMILADEGSQGKSERAAHDEENRAHGVAKRVLLKNPHFVISFTRWRMRCVEVPKLVLRQWNIILKSKINLRDENDKVWPVRIVTSPMGGRKFLSAGWSNFRKAKKIKEGQICAFKFVTGKDNNNVVQDALVRVRRAPSKCPQ